MKKLTKKIFQTAMMAAAMFVVPLSFSALAFAENSTDSQNICSQNIDSELKAAAGCDVTKTVVSPINQIIIFAASVVGIISVAFIVVGAVGFATSSGDAAKVNKAKSTIIGAVIALLLDVLAFGIVLMVTQLFAGASNI